MVAMVLGCIAWTLWLIILSVDPNAVANFLMNTSEFDDGQFWLIPDEWNTLQTFSVMGLVLVLLFYFYVLLMMLVWRSQKNAMQNKLNSFLLHWKAAARVKISDSLRSTCSQRAISTSWKLYFRWRALTGINGKHRKYWNFCLKIHDLVMLTLLLGNLLEAGTPVRIAYGFSALAALNSVSCAIGILFSRFSALVEIFVDSVFDFSATVIYR
ncbi:hypothetical protein PF005_g25821 [Phytophthora fragariae]|uniref:ABC transmembrane type-1 domain-containing protein n=1 Tax=Phytophthora fragariae TaxID=53985 RepID=A0A6A3W1K0_9STRA|nr:hypothetical protein PF011_g13218 [Phytophthora fragariae]KAE9072668.1 hypothetical protein PF010_g25392 [Phytophthora fragariae]KAE9073239.1 hypothetical protein PF007_g25879 [Phytophthora fragariae]KAE9174518.1 hypothetical protein PF005_g25821 [Phytophthora fragariae]KAE9212356.1 hypothetical protein PF002_g18278 [Phytophthora fragariae]